MFGGSEHPVVLAGDSDGVKFKDCRQQKKNPMVI